MRRQGQRADDLYMGKEGRRVIRAGGPATMRVLGWSTLPLGAACGGFFGETLGVRAALVMAALGGMTAFLWLLCSPLRRMREPVVLHS